MKLIKWFVGRFVAVLCFCYIGAQIWSVTGDVSPCSTAWRYRCYCTGHHDGYPFDWQIDQQASSRKERTPGDIFYDFTCAKLAALSLEGIDRSQKCERKTVGHWKGQAEVGIRALLRKAGMRKIRKTGGHRKVQLGSRSECRRGGAYSAYTNGIFSIYFLY
ncbi:unnamed protein product [Brugia pahangi]|uniref:Uncharacterized protein n=1 Tax=Brugia pahangi TaxID=6280 RepID=A0A0N4THW0_BRUPA|nr:unnamed protein product [Brugia pahangi]